MVGGRRQQMRLDEESSPYWFDQSVENKDDKSGTNTVDGENKLEMYKKVEAEGKESGGERGTLGWRERGSPALLIPFASWIIYILLSMLAATA